jgi:hypothetical protein
METFKEGPHRVVAFKQFLLFHVSASERWLLSRTCMIKHPEQKCRQTDYLKRSSFALHTRAAPPGWGIYPPIRHIILPEGDIPDISPLKNCDMGMAKLANKNVSSRCVKILSSAFLSCDDVQYINVVKQQNSHITNSCWYTAWFCLWIKHNVINFANEVEQGLHLLLGGTQLLPYDTDIWIQFFVTVQSAIIK